MRTTEQKKRLYSFVGLDMKVLEDVTDSAELMIEKTVSRIYGAAMAAYWAGIVNEDESRKLIEDAQELARKKIEDLERRETERGAEYEDYCEIHARV